MNNSTLQTLISDLCPKGVKYKELWEVTAWDKKFNGISKEKQLKILSFKHISAKDLKNININSGKIKLLSTGKFEGYTTEEFAGKNTNQGEIITIPSGGSANLKYFNGFFVDSGNILGGSLDNNILNLRYCYYFLLTKINFISSCFRGSGVKHPDMKKILSLKIPMPPLRIQNEIVKILDSFVGLEKQLKIEMKDRKYQYEYYRDKLLDFGEEIEWMAIGELFDFKNGLNKAKKFFGKGTPIINFTDVFKKRSLYLKDIIGKVEVTEKEKELYSVNKNDVLFTRTSETREEIGMASVLLEEVKDCVFSGFVLRARPKTNLLNPKFCSYYLSSHKARKEIVRYSTFTTRALTSGTKLSRIKIPIPTMSEQEKIVRILDGFNILISDISIGLPAEIKVRRLQYEYYRNKLLTFKEYAE